MKDNELVVVLVTSYNHEKFISETIDSILNQTYKNIQIVIVDDFSTDSSRDIILQYAKNYPSKIDYIFNEVNIGVNRSVNRGLEFIKQKYNPIYLSTIASDDVMEKNKIEVQLKYLKNSTHLDAISSRGIYINETGVVQDEISMGDIFNKNLLTDEEIELFNEYIYKFGFGGPLIQSYLFKFDTVYQVKFSLDTISDDYAFILNYINNGFKVGYLNKVLWRYRLHSANTHRTKDFSFIVLDVIDKYVPVIYKKQALFNHYFMHAVYQFFYHKKRSNGLRYFIFALTYLNVDSLQYFSKKFFKGIKWIMKNR